MTIAARYMTKSNRKLIAPLIIALLACLTPQANAQSTNSVRVQINAIVKKIETKVTAGQNTEAALAPELKQLDDVFAQQNGAKDENSAEILYTKAMVYDQALGNFDKAAEITKQIKSDYPDTGPGHAADQNLAVFAQQAEAKKIQNQLAVGNIFPGFSETNNGTVLSSDNYRGKVLLIDFWATWCPACIAETPEILAVYKKYHTQGFEILGVNADLQPEKFTGFIEQNKIPWSQYFDGNRELQTKYNLELLPLNILLDRHGKIILNTNRVHDLDSIVAKALNDKS